MPYNIWCGSNAEDPDPAVKGCRKHIGMGVRYNAEKTKIGMYYTTPVYQFKFGCHYCQNPIIIKTDPGNMDYVIVQGARRVEQRWDPTGNGQVVPDDKSVGRRLADDAMYKLEHTTGDKGKSTDDHPALVSLYDIQDRVKDDYLANRILRDSMRKERKERKQQKEVDDNLKAKMSLAKGLPLLKERDTDIKMAQLLSFQARKDAEDRQEEERGSIHDEDIFNSKQSNSTSSPHRHKSKNGKDLALHLVKKAAGSNQAALLKTKGFGLVVKSLKKYPVNQISTLESFVENKKLGEAHDKKETVANGNENSIQSANSASFENTVLKSVESSIQIPNERETVKSSDEIARPYRNSAVVETSPSISAESSSHTEPNSSQNSLLSLSCDYASSDSD